MSNLQPATSASDVANYVSGKVTFESLSQLSHPDAVAKSFLLVVPSYEVQNVMCPDFWPSGVKCREFIRPVGGRLA